MKGRFWQIVGLLLLTMLLLAVQITSAQEPIALDEPRSGDITAANPMASYRFTVTAGQNLEIEVTALTEGIVPTFTLLRDGAALGVWYALSPQNTLTDRVAFTEGGEYVIQIGSTTPAEGQFTLTLTHIIPPTVLAPDAPASGLLAGGQTQVYQINADAPLLLDVRGLGIVGALSDGGGNVIATFSDQLAGGFFNITTPGQYLLDLSNTTTDTSLTYEVALTRPGGAAPAPVQTEEPVIETPGTATIEFDASGRPIMPETGACILATLNNVRVNVRTGPSGNNPIESTISQFEVYPVTGRNGDRTWYQIDYGEGEGWTAFNVTRLGGNCDDVPFVDAPVAPPATLTATSTSTPIPVTPGPSPTGQSLDPSLGTGDADGDGVPNNQDFCPYVSGLGTQFGGISGTDGCPVDTDGDTIVDGLDECPFDGGSEENNGCP